MAEFLFSMYLAIVMLGVGLPICTRLGRGSGLTLVEQSLAGYLVGGLIVGLCVWAVGAQVYSPTSMGVLLGVVGVISLPGLWIWGRLLVQQDHRPLSFGAPEKLLWLIIGGLFGATMLWGLAPPADSDAVRYHLLIPRRDLELGLIQAIYGWSIYEFFPSLLEMLFRFGLAVSGPRSAHFIHSTFTLAAAAGTWALARRVGLASRQSLLAVALFLSIRIIIYQASTADVDQGVIAAFVMLVVLSLVWRDTRQTSLIVLMGLIGGVLLNIKYTGIPLLGVVGLVMLLDTLYAKKPVRPLFLFALVALGCMVPLLLRNGLLTGNPLFPLYNHLFGPDRVNPLAGTESAYATARGIMDFLLQPITIFLSPGKYDGFQLGSVMLLVFMPFAWLARKRLNGAGYLCSILLVFLVVWYLVMTQQVRFMQPVFPIMAVFAALGAGAMWGLVKPYGLARGAFFVLSGLLVVNQAMFFGGTAIRRLPVAVGLVSNDAYLLSPPYINNTHLEACRFLEDRLKPGERYLSLLVAPSYYCPQGPVLMQVLDEDTGKLYSRQPLRTIEAAELAQILRRQNVRWVIDNANDKKRKNKHAFQNADFFRDRFAPVLNQALARTTPRLSTPTARIYSVDDIMAALPGSAD